METAERIECTRCFMPFEKRFVNDGGECVICHEHRKKWLNRDYEAAEKELSAIFEYYRRRNKDRKYDCILAFSGGKDSAYALYLIKEKYGMRPLAVTGDNGLLTERALRNMKTIVDRLGVDHLIVPQDHEELKELYRAYFKKTKNFCEICYLTITNSLGQAAVTHDVPLMITGFAFKVDSSHFRAAQRYCFEDAFASIVKDTIPAEVYRKYITKGTRAASHFHLLHLFDYVNHVEKEIYPVLEREFGWDRSKGDDRHYDCRFHHMLGYLRLLNNDFTSLALMTPAALLRDGQIALSEFHEMLEKEKGVFQRVERAQLEDFLEFFDIDEEFLAKPVASAKLAEAVIGERDFEPLIKAKDFSGKGKAELIEMLIDIIRPEIKRDGGDIRVAGFENNVLKVHLLGACRGCMIADQVMIRYLEYLVRKYISEDVIVENWKELAP